MLESKFKVGERVIYDKYPCLVTMCFHSDNSGFIYRLNPIFWKERYNYLNTWIGEDLIKLDYQYLRNMKLKSLGL